MNERLKILEMLKEGIISVDEAENLLKTLDNIDENKNEEKKALEKKEVDKNNSKMRMLKVRVNSAEGDIVNVNIPIAFLKAAIAAGNINSLLNKTINIKGFNNDIITDNINIDILVDYINNDLVGEIVDVTSAEGDIVKVYIE